MRRYRRGLPRLARAALYPDAVWLADAGADLDVRVDATLRPDPVPSPEAPAMNFWPEAAYAGTPVFRPPEAFVARLGRALVWPRVNLVLTSRRAAVRESTSTVLPITPRAWTMRVSDAVRPIAGVSTVFRSVHNNFFHTLLDNAPRLFWLRRPPLRDIGEIALLLPSPPTPLEAFVFERYLPGNVRVEVVGADGLVAPEVLVFPSFLSKRSVTWLPPEFIADFVPRFVPDRPRRRSRRLFIARRPSARGRLRLIENEDALWSMLEARGFERVTPETLAFEDQIALFYDAECVVAAHGAGLSNLVFAEDARVVELFPSRMTMPHYYFLSRAMGHRYRWWAGDRHHFDDGFEVDVAAVAGLLADD